MTTRNFILPVQGSNTPWQVKIPMTRSMRSDAETELKVVPITAVKARRFC